MLNVTTMKCSAVAHCDFVFENGWILASAGMDHTVILDIRAIADANVVHIAAQDCVAPDGRLLADVDVADYLRALVNVRALRNLRLDTAKWSNHIFAIVAQLKWHRL